MRSDPGPLVREKSDRVVRIAAADRYYWEFVRQRRGNDSARIRREGGWKHGSGGRVVARGNDDHHSQLSQGSNRRQQQGIELEILVVLVVVAEGDGNDVDQVFGLGILDRQLLPEPELVQRFQQSCLSHHAVGLNHPNGQDGRIGALLPDQAGTEGAVTRDFVELAEEWVDPDSSIFRRGLRVCKADGQLSTPNVVIDHRSREPDVLAAPGVQYGD